MDNLGTNPDRDGAEPYAVTIDLPSTADAAGIARRFVEEHRDHLALDVVDDAKLLVSEIVTNAVVHGKPEVTLVLRIDPPGLGVVVADEGRAQPHLPDAAPDADAPSGRGLLIIDAIASAWGVSPNAPPPGKSVWFELRRLPAASSPD